MGSGNRNRAICTDTWLLPRVLIGEGKAHSSADGYRRNMNQCFAQAIDVASTLDEGAPMAEGLRRLGIVHHLQGETAATGIHYCQRSCGLACRSIGREGACRRKRQWRWQIWPAARAGWTKPGECYCATSPLSPGHPDLTARIEQNLGILESVQGNFTAALDHYSRALQAYEDNAQHPRLREGASQHRHDLRRPEGVGRGASRPTNTRRHLARQGGDYHLQGLWPAQPCRDRVGARTVRGSTASSPKPRSPSSIVSVPGSTWPTRSGCSGRRSAFSSGRRWRNRVCDQRWRSPRMPEFH